MKQVLKECIECGNMGPIWSKGRCLRCSKPKFKKLKSKYKEKSPYLRDFYISEIKIHSDHPYSFESNTFIGSLSGVNVAHIFPKESYKSVATHSSNIIILTWEEHTRFDELLNTFNFSKLEEEFENSWEKICGRVTELLPLCTEHGKLRSAFEEYLK